MKSLLRSALSRDVLPLLVAGGALTAFGMGYLGFLSSMFDLVAQFSAHWLLIAVIAVIASFTARRTYVVLSYSLIAACVLPVAVTSWYTFGSDDGAPLALGVRPAAASTQPNLEQSRTRRRFKLLVFNTYNLNTNIDAIELEISRHNADVVMLIEFGPNKRAMKPLLERSYPHHKSCDRDWDCALALYSRLPVTSFKLVGPRDDAGPSYIKAELMIGGQAVSVVGTHVLSPNHGPRANFIELDHLAAMARERKGPMVVAGDLNTTIWAHAFDNFRRKSGLTHMGHLIPTWPVRPMPLPQLGIDHVFTSSELRISKVIAGRAAGSDHIPLVATIELR